MSDKQIVEQSDLIDFLLPGDVIIADRGFTCDDYARMALAKVNTPCTRKEQKEVGEGPSRLEQRTFCCTYSLGEGDM